MSKNNYLILNVFKKSLMQKELNMKLKFKHKNNKLHNCNYSLKEH